MRPLGSLLAILLLAVSTFAVEPEPSITRLVCHPSVVEIHGADDCPQLVVTGITNTGREIDLTATAEYVVQAPELAKVDADGRLFPAGNGSTSITIKHQDQSVSITVKIADFDKPRPINFANHIEPILTKLGCNSGGCHGKIAGQNGFRLSLLGFDPDLDYMTLTKEGRGRRLLPAAPEQSLFLQKATGQAPHGGGKKTEVGSEEYKLLHRWIATGMPYGNSTDPVVERLSIFPASRVISHEGTQQLAVYAHYSDGTIEDVTRRAQYESNETDIATVNEAGLVHTLTRTGQAAIMVRFSGLVDVFRSIVPRTGLAPKFTFQPRTVVDEFTLKKWNQLGIVPSGDCTDDQFLRRVSLDITGTLPTAKQVKEFLADRDPEKRSKLVDRLLESPEYAYYFSNKWADILKVRRRGQAERASGTFAFHQWILDSIAEDKPYDQFVREIVSSNGDETQSPATTWFKEIGNSEQFVDDLSQLFLGQRLACANCHHHPYEKWSQDDYWGLAAFYSRLGKKTIAIPGSNGPRNQKQIVFTKPTGSLINKRTNRPATPTPLDSAGVEFAAGEDPRDTLVDWLTSSKNPYFARAIANRYWAHFFSRGIVEPLDDMRVTNPPSNPELLDALAKTVVDNEFRLKELIKVICKSRTYQLSAIPNEFNESDRQSFARYYPRRLTAEVVFDAVCQVTGSPAEFPGLPRDRYAPKRAIQLPDEGFQSYFLDVFGRPQRISACECERVNESSLAMTLHLLNSQEVQDKLSRTNGKADQLASDPRPDAEKVTELFLASLGKPPTSDQLELAFKHLEKHDKNKKLAYENILWALINSKAFLFNQ